MKFKNVKNRDQLLNCVWNYTWNNVKIKARNKIEYQTSKLWSQIRSVQNGNVINQIRQHINDTMRIEFKTF